MPTISLERLAFGGDAVGRLDGKTIFVPLGAPGDVADIDVVDDRQRWGRGALRELQHAGPGRIDPTCRHFTVCGGCQWQHLAPSVQHDAKRDIVREHLVRIAGLRDVEVRSTLVGPAWSYRDRLTLACRSSGVGLCGLRSHDVVAISDCAIASPRVLEGLPLARTAHAALGDRLRRLTIVGRTDGIVLVVSGGRPTAAAARSIVDGAPTLRGLVWRGAGKRIAIGDVDVQRPLEPGMDLHVPADVFMQVSGWAHTTLVSEVLRLVGPPAGQRVIDLYCGAGTLTLPLAKRGAIVHGIEREALAVAAARANATRLGLTTFTAVAATVSTGLAGAPDADVVVLDPPRRGAAEAVDLLLARRPARIVYVSCDAATFARDAGRLVRGGYALDPVQPIDAFPQTYHVEIAAGLRLT